MSFGKQCAPGLAENVTILNVETHHQMEMGSAFQVENHACNKLCE